MYLVGLGLVHDRFRVSMRKRIKGGIFSRVGVRFQVGTRWVYKVLYKAASGLEEGIWWV